jgi:hypothetical protein
MNALPGVLMKEGLSIVAFDERRGIIETRRGFGILELPVNIRFRIVEQDHAMVLTAEYGSWLGGLALGADRRVCTRIMDELEREL